MFPKSGLISETDTLLYNSPGENHVTASPTRVFPDLDQILDGNTNAESGACQTGPIAPPVPVPVKECFSEFLPTADYVGVAGVNASPLSLHFRLTARDGKGGVNAADTTVLIATNAGPFLVTSHAAADSLRAGSTQTVTWNVANTTAAPLNTANVRISLSTDGGHTYPHVLVASAPNDGSQAVVLPNVGTTEARIKVEAVDGVFFDVSNADLEIRDAATQLAELVSFSTGLGIGNALEQLARSAQRQLQKGNVADACDTLQSFLNQVKAQTGKSLTPAQAAELTLRATTIRTALGC
jgi:trimeric autotransporter adhesin